MAYTTINKSTDYFNTLLYTGNNTSPRSITGVGFQPDFVWIKDRSDASVSPLADVVRGANKSIKSSSNDADETNSAYGYLTSFDSDGFSMAIGSSNFTRINENSNSYVSWNWKAGTTSSISGGSITPSSVSINTTSGFGIYKWTGTGSTGTIAHGLGAVPKFMLIKNLSSAESWRVYHQSLGNATSLKLNTSDATFSDTGAFNSTTPSSTLFTVGNSDSTNKSGDSFVAYVFAEKPGYSKFNSFVGNGNADGTFIYTGFKPAYVLTKSSSTTKHWICFDNQRANTFNPQNERILLSSNSAAYEDNNRAIDFLSNGFKMRDNGTDSSSTNSSGSTQIYMAFAEEPLVANVGASIPATAR